jgi:hypothetical protein
MEDLKKIAHVMVTEEDCVAEVQVLRYDEHERIGERERK